MSAFPGYDEILSGVPEYDGFPTIDRLEAATDETLARHPGVTAWRCGTSRAGHPIRCLEVGGGPRRAVLLGLPHPEEPVGVLALEYLLPLLAESDLCSRLGFRFSIVKTGDPDGARLNEPWFAHPHDLVDLVLNVYRPAGFDQPEWTYPFTHGRYGFSKPLPEAEAVIAVLEREPVDFMMSLHNSTFAGAYFYVSGGDRRLCEDLAAAVAAAGIPPHRGEPEVPYLEILGDAVFRQFGLKDEYDYLQRFGEDPAATLDTGTSSDDYAASRLGCFTAVAEVPYFSSGRIADLAPAGLTRAAAKLRGIEIESGYLDWLRARYPEAAARVTQDSPWLRTVYSYLMHAKSDLAAERRMVERLPEFESEATGAQLFDSVCLRELFALCRIGQFARMLAAEPEPDERLEALGAEATDKVRERVPELARAGDLRPAALRAGVQIQVAALLYCLDYLGDERRSSMGASG